MNEDLSRKVKTGFKYSPVLLGDLMANAYSTNKVFDPTLTIEEKVVYGAVAAGTLLDASCLILTGKSFGTLVQDGVQEIYKSFKQYQNSKEV